MIWLPQKPCAGFGLVQGFIDAFDAFEKPISLFLQNNFSYAIVFA